ncbi:hypothetical protein M1O24_02385, partial [Dehalococcoidia bacterium]|nr:hypothetical protein [Dehalococcoidia bacterium]
KLSANWRKGSDKHIMGVGMAHLWIHGTVDDIYHYLRSGSCPQVRPLLKCKDSLKISPRIKVPEIFYVSKRRVLKKDYGFSNLEEILHVTRGPAHENASILAYDF